MLAPMLHLEPWNCSHASLRFIWELVIFLRNSLLIHLDYFERKKKIMLMIFTYICLSLSKVSYENSPKVIDIQGGYNKKFMKIIGQNKIDS